ncbi:TPA: DUF1349 domain-containing protein [Streptococcus suis]|nr:DUF1349 domain-containing protein [Streptococcus suis]
MNTKNFYWVREPENYQISDNEIRITTQAHTDLWQKTYYHFVNDNAPLLLMDTEEEYFSFTVKTDFSNSHTRFDQCGVVVYQDSENWIKGSIEYENEDFQHLGSVVTNQGFSDWATQEIPASVKSIYYRLSRRGSDFCIENSKDGVHFEQMRICHLLEGGGKIRFGIYACSPEDSSFEAIFSEMTLTDCKWLAHDGQQPD